MTPLFACFPVCLLFVAIAIIAGIVVIFDVANRIPGDDQLGHASARLPGKTGPPPWWVMILMIAAIVAIMLALAWYWPE